MATKEWVEHCEYFALRLLRSALLSIASVVRGNVDCKMKFLMCGEIKYCEGKNEWELRIIKQTSNEIMQPIYAEIIEISTRLVSDIRQEHISREISQSAAISHAISHC